MRHILSLLLRLGILSSCTIAPTPITTTSGKVANFKKFGGKAILTYNADGSMGLTVDDEVSFQHGAQTVTAIASMGAEVLLEQISAVTARLANDNLTSIERLKLTNELSALHAQLGFALKQQGIGAGAALGPINFE
jgi:hypothetical protein